MSAPPLISATWFPLKTRTLTTAIGTLAGNCGIVVCFTTGLYILKPESVMILLRAEAVFSTVLLIICTIYFPGSPHFTKLRASLSRESWTTTLTVSAPDQSKLMAVMQFWKDLWAIVRIPAFDLAALACGCTVGMYSGWQAVLLLVLGPLGYSQEQVGWMGFASTCFGIFAGIVAGRFADWTGRRMKPVYLTIFWGILLAAFLFINFRSYHIHSVILPLSARNHPMLAYRTCIRGDSYSHSVSVLYYACDL